MKKDFGQVKDCEEAAWILEELFPKKSFCCNEERWIHQDGSKLITHKVYIFAEQFGVSVTGCTVIEGDTWADSVRNTIKKIEEWENGQTKELQEAVPADICLETDRKVIE